MKPEDAMYDILPLIGQDYDLEHERLVKDTHTSTFKNRIVDAINNELNENYSVYDLFKNNRPNTGALHYLGYKLLKDKYEFLEANIKFSSSTGEYIKLSRLLKGLYYMTKPNKYNECTLYSTDKYSINIVILSGGDFKDFCKMLDN